MKKIFLFLISFCASLSSFAKDEVGIAPNSTLVAGTATELWFYINFPSYDTQLLAITIDAEFPAGWAVGTSVANFDDNCKWDYDFDEPGSNSHFAMSGAKKTGYMHYVAYSTDLMPYYGSEGKLFSVKVKAPASTNPGYYPVKILASTYCSKSSVDAENLTWTTSQTSYVKVGNPTEVSVVPVSGTIPSFMVKDLNNLISLDLHDATEINGDLNLSNVSLVSLPEEGVTVEGTTSYTRNLSTQYGTVCVPFALTSTEETQYYELSEMTGNKLTFQPVDVVAAGTPALVKGNISASVNNATLVAPVSGAMVGTYSNIKPGAVGYFIGENAFWALESTTKVGSYKAYIPGALGAKSLKIFIEDETGIHEVSSEISSDDIYNLQGMKLNKTQKGINIVGGKKVILK